MIRKIAFFLALATFSITPAQAAGFSAYEPVAADSRNLPKDGKILFMMGQDSETLTEYSEKVLKKHKDMPRPGGITLYTNIIPGGGTEVLGGLEGPTNYGAGTISFKKTLAEYPDAALALGLALSDAYLGCKSMPTRMISMREAEASTPEEKQLVKHHHQLVDKLVNYLRELDRPVYLRIGYEFDGNWNCYDRESFISAFRHIKNRIDALGASNVATVWQSAAYPQDISGYNVSEAEHLDKWYPGDDVVDWVGLSIFLTHDYNKHQWSAACKSLKPKLYQEAIKPRDLQDKIVAFARTHKKPVMVAEAAPQGYSNNQRTASCIFHNNPTQISSNDIWNLWYADFFSYLEKNRDVIRAASYINTNWQNQGMWHCKAQQHVGDQGCPAAYWGDSRVQANRKILKRFKNELQKHFYVNGTEPPDIQQTVQN